MPPLAGRRLASRRGADVDALALAAHDAEDLDRLVAGGPEPVQDLGVELGDLPGTHDEVVAGEDQPQLPIEDVEPLVALVRPQLRFAPFGFLN